MQLSHREIWAKNRFFEYHIFSFCDSFPTQLQNFITENCVETTQKNFIEAKVVVHFSEIVKKTAFFKPQYLRDRIT